MSVGENPVGPLRWRKHSSFAPAFLQCMVVKRRGHFSAWVMPSDLALTLVLGAGGAEPWAGVQGSGPGHGLLARAGQETGKRELWLQVLIWRLGILNSTPGLTCKDKETTCLAATALPLCQAASGGLVLFCLGFYF